MKIANTNYQNIKDSIRGQLGKVAESFVIIGYQLKQVRDNELFMEDGYKDIYEFAQAEFNLGKSNTSRFMAINDKFSVEGNSQSLIEEYQDYGSSKLAEMLTLSEEELKLISNKTTVKEIREIKQVKQENEAVATSQQTDETLVNTQSERNLEVIKNPLIDNLKKLAIEFFREEKQKEKLLEITRLSHYTDEFVIQNELIAIINPSEHLMFKKGLLIAALETVKDGIKINMFGKPTETYKYIEFYQTIKEVFNLQSKDPWKEFYMAAVDIIKEPKSEVKESKSKDDSLAAEGQAHIDEYEEYLPEDYENKRVEIPQHNVQTEQKEVKEVVHELKIAKMFFVEVLNNTKKFELRKKDRDFKLGDILKLMEYDNGDYTGREIISEIIYILEDYTGLTEGYCILGLGQVYEN